MITPKTCPGCGSDTIVLVTNLKTGERFCPACATEQEEKSGAVRVARKIAEHTVAGTLHLYSIEERLADLYGRKYAKTN